MTAPTRSHLLAAVATVTATMSLLAGCTGGTSASTPPATTATSQASTTPSASATPTTTVAEAPQWTEDMDQVSPDAALAVGRYFLELFPYVIETGDTTEWDRLSHPECTFCSEVAASVAGTAPPGDAVQMNIVSAAVQEIQQGGVFKGTYSITEVSPDGTSEGVTAYAAIVNDEGRWLVRGIQFGPAEGTDG
ncbi:MAG: hypothetical protein HGA44_18360 [Cellulomonadaceae bacterium]|nr:hypothetical protein [Cellulomonadaceae bacterium]